MQHNIGVRDEYAYSSRRRGATELHAGISSWGKAAGMLASKCSRVCPSPATSWGGNVHECLPEVFGSEVLHQGSTFVAPNSEFLIMRSWAGS